LFAVIAQRVGGKARVIRSRTQSQLADLTATMQETLSVPASAHENQRTRALAFEKFQQETRAYRLANQAIDAHALLLQLDQPDLLAHAVLVYWLSGYLIVQRAIMG